MSKVMSQSIYSNKPLRPQQPEVVRVELEVQETYLQQLEPVELELEQQLVVQELDWAILISFETTLNSNNFARSSNRTLRCSSQSCNKLELVTQIWLN